MLCFLTWAFSKIYRLYAEVGLLGLWSQLLLPPGLASSNFIAITCKVIKFTSKRFQAFEWQPIKRVNIIL